MTWKFSEIGFHQVAPLSSRASKNNTVMFKSIIRVAKHIPTPTTRRSRGPY